MNKVKLERKTMYTDDFTKRDVPKDATPKHVSEDYVFITCYMHKQVDNVSNVQAFEDQMILIL